VRAPVSVLAIAIFALGCGSGAARTLPRDGLVARATSGREPPLSALSPREVSVIAFAAAQIGKPYCWGGTGPACFDCSGLAQTAWQRAGARLPRTSDQMSRSLAEVRLEDVRPGDILWWPGHVGIYTGSGWMIDARDARHGVVYRPARDPYRALRP
jgi:peptidoglycan DL-endopeptidase CwlO